MNRVYKNIFASVLPQFVNIISNFILPGLIILKFGSEVNGLVSATKTVVSYISIVGAGIATAVTQSLYEPVAKRDAEEIKGMLHAANRMFVKFGLLYVAITAVTALLYPLCVSSDINGTTIALLLIVMSLSGASEFFVTGRCRALLYADQKVYICNIIQAASLLLSLFAAVLMLKADVGIVWVQLAISLVYVLRAAVLLGYVNTQYPQLRGFKRVPAIEKAVSKRNDAMIHQLSGLAVTGSQPLILSVLVGFEAASIYAVYNIVFSGLQSICANINVALTPYLGRELSLGNEERTKDLYDIIEFGFSALVTFVFSVAVMMIIPFIRLYTAGADINYAYKDFALLFALSSMFYILKMPGTAAINAAGHFRETRSRALLEAGICIVLGVMLTAVLGMNGVLLGALAALAWRCLDTVVYTNRYILKTAGKTSLKRVAVCMVTVLVFAAISVHVELRAASYMMWVIYACGVSLFAAAVVAVAAVLLEKTTIRKIVLLIRGKLR